jgi:hypothetical protein
LRSYLCPVSSNRRHCDLYRKLDHNLSHMTQQLHIFIPSGFISICLRVIFDLLPRQSTNKWVVIGSFVSPRSIATPTVSDTVTPSKLVSFNITPPNSRNRSLTRFSNDDGDICNFKSLSTGCSFSSISLRCCCLPLQCKKRGLLEAVPFYMTIISNQSINLPECQRG